MKRGDVAELAGSWAWMAFGVLTMVVVGHGGVPLSSDAGLLSWSRGTADRKSVV